MSGFELLLPEGVLDYLEIINVEKAKDDTSIYLQEENLNFFENRNTNASAEFFNAKIKAFGSQFRGVRDIPFFLI
ncbi:MAG TPA: hypothetical protein VK152_07130 [Paludibacter sp.]|nr:hypothetical protein [Paludibacter sp.]